LSRLGNGERNLAKPKAARPSERARASQTGLWFSPIYDLRFRMDAAKPLIASIVNRISQPSPAGLPRRRQVKPSQAKIKPKSNRFKPKKWLRQPPMLLFGAPSLGQPTLPRQSLGEDGRVASKRSEDGSTIKGSLPSIAAYCQLLPAFPRRCFIKPASRQNHQFLNVFDKITSFFQAF